jgi:predicted metal-dependent hydrolase
MEDEVVNIQGVDVIFFRSHRAKRLNITIKPFVGVRVSVPRSVSFKKARALAEDRISWIKTHLSKMQKAEGLLTVFHLDTKFQTRSHHLEMKFSDTATVKTVVGNNTIAVAIPHSSNIEDPGVQNAIRQAIELAWRKEAKIHLPDRVKVLAAAHKFEYKNVAIKNSKTRWGSCSFDNNINLSLHLMRLPDHLVDYVILHELVHTRVKNHSKDFWQLLDIVSGEARKLDREVKGYGIKIY